MDLLNYSWVSWKVKSINIKNSILAKNKLINVKSIISKAMQERYISVNDNAFINKEVNRYDMLKWKIRKKQKCKLTDFWKEIVEKIIKNVLMNLSEIYLMKCINENCVKCSK